MAKSSINRKYSLNASGVLDINEDGIFLEIATDEECKILDLKDIIQDFDGRCIKLSINYDEGLE